MQDLLFSFEGVSYAVTGEVQFGGSIQLPDPDNRYLLVTSWNKIVPPTPARFQVIDIPPIGGKIWHARRQSQIRRPDTMNPHDQSRRKVRDPYRGFPRGIMSVFFKEGTTDERIGAILAEVATWASVVSSSHPFPGDANDGIRRLGDVRLDSATAVADFVATLKQRYPEAAGAHEVLPQICDPFVWGAGPKALAAPMHSPMASLPGGMSDINTPFDPYHGFPRGLLSVTFKSGTSNATIADVLRRAKRYLRYVKNTDHPFPKYLGKGQDAIRRHAYVNLSDPSKVDQATAWLLKQPSVRGVSEVLPAICM